MTIEDIRARFPDDKRRLWEVDRILVEEPNDSGGTRMAIDLRAAYSQALVGMGAGSVRLGRQVPVIDGLVGMDAYLDGVVIERLDAWGSNLDNKALSRLMELQWFSGLLDLNLGSNRITKKGVDALVKHPVAAQLQELRLSYNKVGAAFAKASFPELERLEVVYGGVTDKVLPGFGAELPKLKHLVLDGAAVHTTVQKIHDNEVSPTPSYDPEAFAAFAGSPVAARLESLSLGYLTIDETLARVIGGHFDALEELSLADAVLTPASATALVSGAGLGGLQTLNLRASMSPNYNRQGERQSPSRATADVMAAIGTSNFAQTLSHLVLDLVVVGNVGIQALLSHPLPGLRRLDASNAQLGDDGLASVLRSGLGIEILVLGSNGITANGIRALVESPLAGQLTALNLEFNDIKDEGVRVLASSERLPALRSLSLMGTRATDDSARALAGGPVLPRLKVLILMNNRISDEGADLLLAACGPDLERLHLGENCLSPEGVAAAQAALPNVALYLDKQDVSKLPPRFEGNAIMRFVEVEGIDGYQKPPPVSANVREAFPYPAWTERSPTHHDWVFAMPKGEDGYEVGAMNADSGHTVMSDPLIANPLPMVNISLDGRWMSVKAFRDAAYVVSLEDGATTRLGDVLTHQTGGSGFCDGRVVILDVNTDDDWQGRIDVYAETADGWVQEHAVTGIRGVRDDLVMLANQRMFAVTGRGGLFLCAVRGDQFRYLGRLLADRFSIFDQGGRVFITVWYRFTYELTNIDEVLDAAFAEGESPTDLGLSKEDWGLS